MGRRTLHGFVIAASLLLALGCSSDKKNSDKMPYGELTQHSTTRPTSQPTVIYVGHFDLGQTILKNDPGLVNKLTSVRPRLIGNDTREPTDPQERITFLAELLATTLVKELNAKHINAQRLTPTDATASSGWEVSGVLVKVDEGNRLGRSLLGFGTGASDVQLTVAVTNLRYGHEQPFIDLALKSEDGKKVGSPVTISPFAAAAKYRMNQDAGSKDVETAAKEIAADLEWYIKDIEKGK